MLIGVAGFPCAGKDMVADFLAEKGFTRISLSDILRDGLRTVGVPITRKNLVELGLFIREHAGGGHLTKFAIEKVGSENVVIAAIRHPEEVLALKELGGVFVFITASRKTRFGRMSARSREQDPPTWESFLMQELREHGTSDGNDLRLADCLPLADHFIENEGTTEELKVKVDGLLEKISVSQT